MLLIITPFKPGIEIIFKLRLLAPKKDYQSHWFLHYRRFPCTKPLQTLAKLVDRAIWSVHVLPLVVRLNALALRQIENAIAVAIKKIVDVWIMTSVKSYLRMTSTPLKMMKMSMNCWMHNLKREKELERPSKWRKMEATLQQRRSQ